jgi:hypothetical protein
LLDRPDMNTVKVYDEKGRFVGRIASRDLARVVKARLLERGWALAHGAELWEPIVATLARVQ